MPIEREILGPIIALVALVAGVFCWGAYEDHQGNLRREEARTRNSTIGTLLSQGDTTEAKRLSDSLVGNYRPRMVFDEDGVVKAEIDSTNSLIGRMY